MAEVTRSDFENRAHDDPYGRMSREDMEFIADTFDIIPIDAAKADDIPTDMTWTESHIGGGGLMYVTDYGRHRDECDNLAEFQEFVRDKIRDDLPSQFLKVMDDDQEEVAEKLVAITKANGYIAVPYFGDADE